MGDIKMGWIEQLQEAGFEDKPKGWDKGSIKKYTKTFTKKMKGDAKSEGFFDKCVKKMQGKMENPEGFCASLKDEAYGSTYWRGKDKKPSAVKAAVAKHQNVKEDAKIIPMKGKKKKGDLASLSTSELQRRADALAKKIDQARKQQSMTDEGIRKIANELQQAKKEVQAAKVSLGATLNNAVRANND